MTSITIQALRSYGSLSHFGPQARTELHGSPFVLDSTPQAGERIRIILGTPPDGVLRAQDVTLATMVLLLTGGLNGLSPDEEDVRIERDVERTTSGRSAPTVWERYAWYTSIVLEREFEVPDADLQPGRIRWVPIDLLVKGGEQFLGYALPKLDEVAAHLTLVLGRPYFEERVCERVFFACAGRESFALPSLNMGGATFAVRGGALPELAPTVNRMRAALRRKTPSGVRAAQTLYMEALIETDPMKRFLFTFDALEMLAHELGHRYYVSVQRGFRTALLPAGSGGLERVMKAMMLRETTATLLARFAVAALALFPSDLEQDLDAFQRIKKARDELAHGKIRDVARLPVADAIQLAEKYLAASLTDGQSS